MANVIDAIIAEALGEGPQGMAAVAHVINTRAQQQGLSADEVVNQPSQFSGVSNPGSAVERAMQDPSIRAQVQQIWDGVTSGDIPNPFPNSDFFHTPQVSPTWSNEFTRTGQMGNHIFYSSGASPVPAQDRTAPQPMAFAARPNDNPALGAIAAVAPAADDFWSPYATGGATRPDSFTGMQDPFRNALQDMFSNAPPEVQLQVTSGYRSPERQAQLWAEALEKYGSEAEARRWVAPPGNSQHNHGHAADLKFLSPTAQAWVHANAEKYGLAFPLGNEPWHVELAGARSGAKPAAPAAQGIKLPNLGAIGQGFVKNGINGLNLGQKWQGFTMIPGAKAGAGVMGSLAQVPGRQLGAIGNWLGQNVPGAPQVMGALASLGGKPNAMGSVATMLDTARPAVGTVLGQAGNGGLMIQGHNGIRNSITQDSAYWQRAVNGVGASSHAGPAAGSLDLTKLDEATRTAVEARRAANPHKF